MDVVTQLDQIIRSSEVLLYQLQNDQSQLDDLLTQQEQRNAKIERWFRQFKGAQANQFPELNHKLNQLHELNQQLVQTTQHKLAFLSQQQHMPKPSLRAIQAYQQT